MNRPLSRFLPAFAASAAFWLVLAVVVVSLAGCTGTTNEDVVSCVKACAPYPAVQRPLGYSDPHCQCVYVPQGGR